MSVGGGGAAMSTPWRDDDEEFRVGGVKGGLKSKPRFSFTEVKMLLEAVKMNRYIILRKFNHGVSAETKKQTWAEITHQINGLGENHREVRQIMKKWADLKCDGKRRIIALRGPNGCNLRKKHLGPVEMMVHKILTLSPRGDGDSDLEFGEDDDPSGKGPDAKAHSYSYIGLTDNSYPLGGGGASYEMSPLSSPEKDLGGDPFNSSSEFDLDLADDGDRTMDYDENEDSLFSSYHDPLPPSSSTASLDPLPDSSLLRAKPVHTYSRNNNQNHTSPRPPPGLSSSVAGTSSSGFPSLSDSAAAGPPPSQSPPPHSNGTASSVPPQSVSASTSAAASASQPEPTTSSTPVSSAAVSNSSSDAPVMSSAPSSSVTPSNPQEPSLPSSVSPLKHPIISGSNPSDPLPAGASTHVNRDHVAQMASQSLQQQRASRMLLTSVSQSLETLAQSVQLLVESQQEFVQESLLLQRETVDILRDFSNTALTMLRDKSNSAPLNALHHHHHHPTPRF